MNRKITPFKKFVALTLTVALVAMMVMSAYATTTALVNDSELTIYSWAVVSNAVIDGRGRQFQGNDQYLSSVAMYCKNGSVIGSGTLRAYLVNATSLTQVSDVYPVETSAAVSIVGLSGAQWLNFYFANTTILLSTNYYTINFVLNSSLSGTFQAGYAVPGGNMGAYHTGGEALNQWSSTNQVLLTKVYTVDTEGGDGEPYTPPGTADLTSWDTIISSFTSFIVPVFVILLPAMLLMFLTRRTDKWLLIIGLVIGVGLGYWMMPASVPLWLVFLVVIGLIGMAYQSVRGGGSN